MQELNELGTVDCITEAEQTAREYAELEELCYHLVLVHCRGQERMEKLNY